MSRTEEVKSPRPRGSRDRGCPDSPRSCGVSSCWRTGCLAGRRLKPLCLRHGAPEGPAEPTPAARALSAPRGQRGSLRCGRLPGSWRPGAPASLEATSLGRSLSLGSDGGLIWGNRLGSTRRPCCFWGLEAASGFLGQGPGGALQPALRYPSPAVRAVAAPASR